MDSAPADMISHQLSRGGTIDITTIGRRTGLPRRIEIWFHNLGGDLYITGRPGFPRDWLANLRSSPHFTFHLKRGLRADLDAIAEEITDPPTREQVLRRILIESWNMPPPRVEGAIAKWVASAPLVRVEVPAPS